MNEEQKNLLKELLKNNNEDNETVDIFIDYLKNSLKNQNLKINTIQIGIKTETLALGIPKPLLTLTRPTTTP